MCVCVFFSVSMRVCVCVCECVCECVCVCVLTFSEDDFPHMSGIIKQMLYKPHCLQVCMYIHVHVHMQCI